MSTLHTRNYKESRKWSDQYEESLNQIASTIMQRYMLLSGYWLKPSLNEDRRMGIDMHIITDPVRFSYRVRKSDDLRYWEMGFTVRTSSRGYPSELEKIQTPSFADFLLYAIAHPSEYGVIQGAVMIDLKSVGAQLVADSSIIEKATKKNDFIEFKYTDFPATVVVGIYGIDEKGELKCR